MRRDAVTVEAARPADAPAIAALHTEGIDEGFLSTLGPRFLATFYRAMAGSPAATVLVARREGRVVGFVAGSAEPGRFYREFLRRKAFTAMLALVPRTLRPSVAIGAAETLRHIRRVPDREPAAELIAVAVGLTARRTGFGAALVARLEEELRAAGATRLAVVVGTSNAAARAFYERLGFANPLPLEVHRGTPLVRYVKAISAPAAR